MGSPYAAITFSYEVARQLGAKHGFAEKNPKFNPDLPWDEQTEPRFIWNRFKIPRGSQVLPVEELITTLGTVLSVRHAIEAGNPEPVFFSPDIATAIFRPATDTNPIGLGDLIYLVKRVVRSWPADECLLCQQGSPALKPKSHWAELTGRAA